MSAPRTLPVTVLTGFLGSGKTTLLNRQLRRAELSDAAVFVNELGEIPLDHILVREEREDVLVLASGCVCCAVRGDLVRALGGLYADAARGAIPPFSRVLVETTGLADPAPVIAALTRDPLVARAYHLASVVTTFDAALGPSTLRRHPESVQQLAAADRVVLTKVDAVSAAVATAAESVARSVNPVAAVARAARGDAPADVLLGPAAEVRAPALPPDGARPTHAHVHDVATFSASVEQPISFSSFALWLSVVTQLHGEHLLRVKAILCVDDHDAPVVVHAVQHVVSPAYTLPAWPDGDRRSHVVVITRGLELDALEQLRAGLLAICGPRAHVGPPRRA